MPAHAQSGASATLSPPDISAFPYIEAYLEVRDAQNRFVHGLELSQVRVIENGRTIAPTELEELYPGLQMVVALNPGPDFAVRNSVGATRAEIILATLEDWVNRRRGSTVDDWSLLTANAGDVDHMTDPQAWLNQLRQARESLTAENLRQAVPSLDTLSRAIEIAAEPSPRPGMGRAVLFITSAFEEQPGENVTAISTDTIISRARDNDIKIYIWMVPTAGTFTSTAENKFGEKTAQEITAQTGGQLFVYQDGLALPDPEDLLSALRKVYRLGYESLIRSSGQHQIAASIQSEAFKNNASANETDATQSTVTTTVQEFELNILPPEPAFISPPLLIQRTPPLDEEGKVSEDTQPGEYLPTQQELYILVSFPDERVRPIVRTSLFIDGVLTSENRQPPYDQFLWDLQDYTTSGSHPIRVEAEDSLGLVGVSIEQFIQINIETPARSPWAWIYRNASALTVFGIVIAGALLLLVLVLGGRIRPRVPGTVGQGGALGSQKKRRKSDPVTQPVVIKVDTQPKRNTGRASRIHWPQRHITPQAEAFLSRIVETTFAENETQGSLSNASATPIPLTSNEITIGSKPELATLLVNDASVESLHARIVRTSEGNYRINDEGSIAGTWVNYTPVSREGVALAHNDLLHIGRVGFRFTLRTLGQVRKPIIITNGQSERVTSENGFDSTGKNSASENQEEPKA